MRLLCLVWVNVLLAACAGVPPMPDHSPLLEDDRFSAPAVPVPARSDSIFATSDEMRAYLDGDLARRVRERGAHGALVDAMHSGLRLDYEAAYTRTAAEAFEARSGNCLSLVILAAALARELQVPVVFQSVYGETAWSRDDTLAFRSSHVNLVLGRPDVGIRSPGREADRNTIDFLPSGGLVRQATVQIDSATVVAMYHNNRAAELLAAGDVNSAYWWARAAIKAAPTFIHAYNTLGVIYDRHGDQDQAERSYRFALRREPENTAALGNLARQLERQGRVAEAGNLWRRLERIEPYPPYYFLDLGMAALDRGDVAGALELLHRERRRMPYDHEVHFGLALASLRLNEEEDARDHLAKAARYSPTQERRQIYAAKLHRLKERSTAAGASGAH